MEDIIKQVVFILKYLIMKFRIFHCDTIVIKIIFLCLQYFFSEEIKERNVQNNKIKYIKNKSYKQSFYFF